MIKYLGIALFAAGLTVFLIRHFIMILFLTAAGGDAIYKNIYINDIPVGGLSRQQAQNVLQKAGSPDSKIIGFVYNDSLIYSFTFADFGVEYDFTALVDEAFLYGKTGTRRQRYRALRALEFEPHKIIGKPVRRYNEALIPERLEAVRAQASILPVNASIRLEAGEFIITEAKPGRTPDMQEAQRQLKQILISKKPGHIELEMHSVLPAYNSGHFENARSLLGSFYTEYWGGDEIPRNINIRLAAANINNTVVYPGEVFSTREAIGPSTPERGYAMAAIIVDGQLTEDYGGGICQVASTLYNAALYAELPIKERANHSLGVQYMDLGFDAAIAGDYMDLKFQNNLEYPILIVAGAQNGILEARIYGHEKRPPNRTIAFVSELVEVIPPGPGRILLDENLPSGHVLVNAEPRNGYKYELFRIVFVDGEQVKREKVNTSIYRPVQGVVTRGP